MVTRQETRKGRPDAHALVRLATKRRSRIDVKLKGENRGDNINGKAEKRHTLVRFTMRKHTKKS